MWCLPVAFTFLFSLPFDFPISAFSVKETGYHGYTLFAHVNQRIRFHSNVNVGPGGIGSIFVHERHANDTTRPRLAGWWSHERDTRFLMKPDLIPTTGALGYQISSPPILCIATLKASLDIFSEAGLDALIAKSKRLTAYLELLITKLDTKKKVKIITSSDESKRGCQLSLIFSATSAKRIIDALLNAGVFCDFREPNCIRVAPVPLYNTFADVYDFVSLLMTLINQYCEDWKYKLRIARRKFFFWKTNAIYLLKIEQFWYNVTTFARNFQIGFRISTCRSNIHNRYRNSQIVAVQNDTITRKHWQTGPQHQ